MPCPSLLPSPPHHGLHNDNVDHWFATVDGRDLDATIALAREIIAAGVWRPGMLRRFIRLHRHEVTRLLRRLGPLVPSHMR